MVRSLVKVSESINRGSYYYEIRGVSYHELGTLYLSDILPSQQQLYAYFVEEACHHRLAHNANSECFPRIINMLHEFVLTNNNYAQILRTTGKIYIEKPQNNSEIRMRIVTEQKHEHRRSMLQ